ncbi:MAG: NAD-dependent epimerase/dehydratase family protein [Pseudomonadota bacterium]
MTARPSPTIPPGHLVVSGASGRIGRRLRRIWAEADVVWHSRADGPLDEAVDGRGTLIALGGVTSGSEAALAANSKAALDALEAARRAGLRRVLLFSSAAIYGTRSGLLSEEMAPTPAAPYGAAKGAQEAAVATWRETYPDGPEAISLRLGNVAGADALLGQLGAVPPRLDIFADGTAPRRSFIGPETLARILLALAVHPSPLPPILNVAAPGAIGMDDLLRAAGRDWTAVTAPNTAIPEVHMDTGRLERLVPLQAIDREPAEIVRQWRATEGCP